GDRDGNPHVTAAMLDHAMRAQAAIALTHQLEEVHRLGAELSLSARLVTPTPELLDLAERGHDVNPPRADEPYRRALSGIYARLASTARALARIAPARAPHAELPPYATADEVEHDLAIIARSLAAHGAQRLADTRLTP